MRTCRAVRLSRRVAALATTESEVKDAFELATQRRWPKGKKLEIEFDEERRERADRGVVDGDAANIVFCSLFPLFAVDFERLD